MAVLTLLAERWTVVRFYEEGDRGDARRASPRRPRAQQLGSERFSELRDLLVELNRTLEPQ